MPEADDAAHTTSAGSWMTRKKAPMTPLVQRSPDLVAVFICYFKMYS